MIRTTFGRAAVDRLAQCGGPRRSSSTRTPAGSSLGRSWASPSASRAWSADRAYCAGYPSRREPAFGGRPSAFVDRERPSGIALPMTQSPPQPHIATRLLFGVSRFTWRWIVRAAMLRRTRPVRRDRRLCGLRRADAARGGPVAHDPPEGRVHRRRRTASTSRATRRSKRGCSRSNARRSRRCPPTRRTTSAAATTPTARRCASRRDSPTTAAAVARRRRSAARRC